MSTQGRWRHRLHAAALQRALAGGLRDSCKSVMLSVGVIAWTKDKADNPFTAGIRPTHAARIVSGLQTAAWQPSVTDDPMSGGGGYTRPSRGNPSDRFFGGLSPSRGPADLGDGVIAKPEGQIS
jgi:hypothetical protein